MSADGPKTITRNARGRKRVCPTTSRPTGRPFIVVSGRGALALDQLRAAGEPAAPHHETGPALVRLCHSLRLLGWTSRPS